MVGLGDVVVLVEGSFVVVVVVHVLFVVIGDRGVETSSSSPSGILLVTKYHGVYSI